MDQKERMRESARPLLSDDPKSNLELEELLAEARRYVDSPGGVRKAAEMPADVYPLDPENENGPPGIEPEEYPTDPMGVMAVQIKELTEEVRQLRTQLSQTQMEHGETGALSRSPNIQEEPEKSRKSKVMNVIGNILFYLVIIGIIAGAFLVKSSSGGRPTMIAGFSAFRVLSSSMEDAYPKGSLIITKSVEPNELNVGDDITFMVSETSSITHRIISITQNYAGTGKPGFETQGVMNEKPDKDMVAASNVVGKVVFCSKFLGDLAIFVKDNWPIMIFAVAVLIALITFLKWNARREVVDEMPTEKADSSKHVRKKNVHKNRKN